VKKNTIPSGASLTAEQDDLCERNAINDIDRCLSVSEKFFSPRTLQRVAGFLRGCSRDAPTSASRLQRAWLTRSRRNWGVSDAPRDMVKDMAKLREVAQFDVRNPGASLSTTAEAVGLPQKKTTVASYQKTPAFKRIRNDEYILYMRQQIRSATAAGDLKTALAVGRELDLYIEAQKNEL
jgi:hypothetical protein